MLILFMSFLAMADTCPVGKLKACQDYLTKIHGGKETGRDFTEKFDEVCGKNKKFLCVKVIVRGDMEEEFKEQVKERGSKAALYRVQLEDENYIYVLSGK